MKIGVHDLSLLGSLSCNETAATRQRQRNGHSKINMVTNGDYIVITASSSHPLLLTINAANGLVEAPLK